MCSAATPARTGLASAALALCAALAATAAPLQYRAVNQNLEQAKKLASSARCEERSTSWPTPSRSPATPTASSPTSTR